MGEKLPAIEYDENGKIIVPKLRLPRDFEEEKREVMAIARVVAI